MESGLALTRLLEEAKDIGVQIVKERIVTQQQIDELQSSMDSLISTQHGNTHKVHGIKLTNGEELRAQYTIVAAGAWTPVLLPHLSAGISNKLLNMLELHPLAQIIFHFLPQDGIKGDSF